MIGIDGSIAQNGTDWFCYHASSACIFPVGFCEINGLILTPPRGEMKRLTLKLLQITVVVLFTLYTVKCVLVTVMMMNDLVIIF